MISPASRCSPASVCAIFPRRGGNLARAYSTRAGLLSFPSRTSQGALCSVLLTRDARSSRGQGVHCVLANRAVCMRERRRRCKRLSVAAAFTSFSHQSAHQFRTDHANRHHASGLGLGAAGSVLRKALPRLLPSFDVYDFAHRGGSTCSLSSTGEHNRRSFHGVGKIIHDGTG